MDKGGDTTVVILLEKHQKTNNRKILNPNKIYLDICPTYNHLME